MNSMAKELLPHFPEHNSGVMAECLMTADIKILVSPAISRPLSGVFKAFLTLRRK
jgi:hypothetical protein